MITPKRIFIFLCGLCLLGLYTLIFGQGGYVRMFTLAEDLAMLQNDNREVREDNERMSAELKSLQTGLGAIEERARYALLKRFSTEEIAFQHCQFYYPSPAFIFEQPDATTAPVM